MQAAGDRGRAGLIGAKRRSGHVTTRRCELRSLDRGRKVVVEDLRRLTDLEGRQDLALALRGRRALGDAAVPRLQGDEVHAVELVAEVAPGVAGRVLGDADEEQAEPAQLDVASDAVLAAMEDGSQPQCPLQVPPSPLERSG